MSLAVKGKDLKKGWHVIASKSGFRRVLKPTMVLTYNEGTKGIDLADQLASYNSPVRKISVWYMKIAADLVSITSKLQFAGEEILYLV